MHFRGGWAGLAQALQKPLRLGHSHASMAAALALHGFAGAASEHPLERVAEDPTRAGYTENIVRREQRPRLRGHCRAEDVYAKRPLIEWA